MRGTSQGAQPFRPVLVSSRASDGASTPLLTIDQVATQLGVSKAWVRDHATRRNPRLPVIRLGGRRALLRFRVEDIHNFIAHHLVQEAPV